MSINVYEDFANNSHEYTSDGLEDRIDEIRLSMEMDDAEL